MPGGSIRRRSPRKKKKPLKVTRKRYRQLPQSKKTNLLIIMRLYTHPITCDSHIDYTYDITTWQSHPYPSHGHMTLPWSHDPPVITWPSCVSGTPPYAISHDYVPLSHDRHVTVYYYVLGWSRRSKVEDFIEIDNTISSGCWIGRWLIMGGY